MVMLKLGATTNIIYVGTKKKYMKSFHGKVISLPKNKIEELS